MQMPAFNYKRFQCKCKRRFEFTDMSWNEIKIVVFYNAYKPHK